MNLGKFWSLVFLLVPIFGVGVFVYGAPASKPIWLPTDASEGGHNIDHLFNFILWLTCVVFIATEGALFWFLWKYNAQSNTQPVKFTHGSHYLEVVWTILPAATLLFIAIYQLNAWADAKMRPPNADDPNVVQLEVRAKQFEWRLRYPPRRQARRAGRIVHGERFARAGRHMVLVHLKSEDVLHSFFLPNMRVKQDAVPGMTIPVWFKPTRIGVYDIVCPQLCGWGHYKMKGRVTVQSEADYEAWLADLQKQQNTTVPPAPPQVAEGK